MEARHQTSFLFDLDGTLVDSVYQHVLAWRDALDQEGIELSVWRIHRKIGMSGGLFTNMLLRETGLDIDQARIERLRRQPAIAGIRRQGVRKSCPRQGENTRGESRSYYSNCKARHVFSPTMTGGSWMDSDELRCTNNDRAPPFVPCAECP